MHIKKKDVIRKDNEEMHYADFLLRGVFAPCGNPNLLYEASGLLGPDLGGFSFIFVFLGHN